MEKAITFTSNALEHIKQAAAWYGKISPDLAQKFQRDLLSALTTLQKHPGVFRRFKKNTRRIVLKNFPYLIVYLSKDDNIVIVAVFHVRKSNRSKRF